MPPSLRDSARIVRFAVVGLLNTAVGYSAILACLALGFGDIGSNAIGYALGLCVGFVLNRDWTFAGQRRSGALPRYLAVFALAYAANLTVVLAASSVGISENAFVHLGAIGVYSVVFYLGCAWFVFAGARCGDGGAAPFSQ
jgi:putative flippase GtrA